MEETSLNIDEIEWKGVPIKYCEFKRANKNFVYMARSDMEYIIMDLTLACVCEEDRDIIIRTMSPTLGECMEGSRDTKRTYLHSLMKLIVFRYKQLKLGGIRSSGHLRDEHERRAHQHYEALRSLKESLILGRSLLERDMPEVKPI